MFTHLRITEIRLLVCFLLACPRGCRQHSGAPHHWPATPGLSSMKSAHCLPLDTLGILEDVELLILLSTSNICSLLRGTTKFQCFSSFASSPHKIELVWQPCPVRQQKHCSQRSHFHDTSICNTNHSFKT